MMVNILDTYAFDIDSINLSNNGLSKLPDLTRFTKLKVLYCCNNLLTELHNLPESLTELYCYNNQLTTLHNLPDSLTINMSFINFLLDFCLILLQNSCLFLYHILIQFE